MTAPPAEGATSEALSMIELPELTPITLLASVERFESQERPVRDPAPGHVLVRVRSVGICGSDIKMYRGKHPVNVPPLVPGHEFFGEVVRAGDGVTSPAPGTIVTVIPRVGCGACYNCARGRAHVCDRLELIGGQRPGGFGRYVEVPAENALPMNPGVPEALRVLVEPYAVGVHSVDRGAVTAQDRCLVIGAGPIGVFTALALRARGAAQILIADLSQERLEVARRIGAGAFEITSENDLPAYVRRTMRAEGIDVAFDCVGTNALANVALACVAKGGRAVLVGIQHDVAVDGVVLQRGERSLIGVQMYVHDDFIEAMRQLAAGAIPPDCYGAVLKHYAPSEVAQAYATLAAGTLRELKAVITF